MSTYNATIAGNLVYLNEADLLSNTKYGVIVYLSSIAGNFTSLSEELSKYT